MKLNSSSLLLSLPLLAVFTAGCVDDDQDPEDGIDDAFLGEGKEDSVGGVSDGSPEAAGVLKAANRGTFDELDIAAKLSSRTADYIVDHRAGLDGVAGTADDRRYATLGDLDAVPYVGPTAIKQLLAFARTKGWVPSPGQFPGCPGTPRFPTTGALPFTSAAKSTFTRDCNAFGACGPWAQSGSDVEMKLEGQNDVSPSALTWVHELTSDHVEAFGGAREEVDIFSSYKIGYPGGGYAQLDRPSGTATGFMNASRRTKLCNAYDCASWSYQYGEYRPVSLRLGATCLSITDDEPASDYGHQVKNIIRLTW